MYYEDDTPPRRAFGTTRVVGFLFGIVAPIVVAAAFLAIYSGQGLGDVRTLPPQVYTAF